MKNRVQHSPIRQSAYGVKNGVELIFRIHSNKQKSKKDVWTPQADSDFVTLKSLVNQCPKLYFLDPQLTINLYDASDYAHRCIFLSGTSTT